MGVRGGKWDIILGGWGIILGSWGWMGKYCGWVGVSKGEWEWVHCLIMPK